MLCYLFLYFVLSVSIVCVVVLSVSIVCVVVLSVSIC